MKILIFYFLTVFTFNTCSVKKIQSFTNDTTEIFRVIYQSKHINDHLIFNNIDSVFIIKNQYYNQSWPDRSNRFIITYINDSKAAREPNPLNLDTLNRKWRLLVPVFNIKTDSANVILYNFNFGAETKYKLKRRKKTWIIVKANVGME